MNDNQGGAVMESPQERRQRETLERCSTPAQRATCERLHSEGRTAWPYKRSGKTVIGEFRRYCETFDPEKIGEGLYDWSIQGSGGLNDIAHFDLWGFRSVYPHPKVYLEELLFPEAYRGHSPRWPDNDGEDFHSQGVYTNGMTKGEVRTEILKIAEENKDRIYTDWKQKRDARALEQAQELAASLGMKVVEA